MHYDPENITHTHQLTEAVRNGPIAAAPASGMGSHTCRGRVGTGDYWLVRGGAV